MLNLVEYKTGLLNLLSYRNRTAMYICTHGVVILFNEFHNNFQSFEFLAHINFLFRPHLKSHLVYVNTAVDMK